MNDIEHIMDIATIAKCDRNSYIILKYMAQSKVLRTPSVAIQMAEGRGKRSYMPDLGSELLTIRITTTPGLLIYPVISIDFRY